jgi:hypothetical protein
MNDRTQIYCTGIYRAHQAVFTSGAVQETGGITAKRAESANVRLHGVKGVWAGSGERIVKGAGAVVFGQDKVCICKCL